MKVKRLKNFAVTFCFFNIASVGLANATTGTNNVIDNPELLYQAPVADDSAIMQKISIKRRFNTIEELCNRLNSINGISTQVKTHSASTREAFLVNIQNGTIKELLNQSANRLGYRWEFDARSGTVSFTALNPVLGVTELSGIGQDNNITVIPTWTILPNDRLISNTLYRWAKQANYQLVWDSKADFEISAGGEIKGSFRQAMNEVLKSFQKSANPIQANWYKNKVIVITSQK